MDSPEAYFEDVVEEETLEFTSRIAAGGHLLRIVEFARGQGFWQCCGPKLHTRTPWLLTGQLSLAIKALAACMKPRSFVIAVVALLAVIGGTSDCWAWGDQGHKVICEIALRLVQPNTRAEIQKLISNDDRFTSFSDACTWPDHPRQRASEHFVNLPRDSDGLHAETCPGASACIVTAIRKDFEVLSSNNASQAQKLASLKFLGHWVGDIHQPLHVSFEDDRGRFEQADAKRRTAARGVGVHAHRCQATMRVAGPD
jgi:S1/P1 Nuclease